MYYVNCDNNLRTSVQLSCRWTNYDFWWRRHRPECCVTSPSWRKSSNVALRQMKDTGRKDFLLRILRNSLHCTLVFSLKLPCDDLNRFASAFVAIVFHQLITSSASWRLN